jgi:hypothetical protein
MKAVAYVHGPERVHKLGRAFAQGCAAHGIPCPVKTFDASVKPFDVDVVWLYGLGPARPVFDAYEKNRIVMDKGYFAEYADPKNKYFRYSIDSQQPTQAMVKDHPDDRWRKFGLKVEPVKAIGEYILICGIGPKQCERLGVGYGDWEREKFGRCDGLNGWRAVVREKPKNPLIDGARRCTARTASEAIRGARTVICKTGNMGADAILHGIPVRADAGPGSLAYRDRQHALNNFAYWQWTPKEMASGEFMTYLKERIL